MKHIQAPNAHRAGVSHISFAQVLAFCRDQEIART
jgi:hypothetical protein